MKKVQKQLLFLPVLCLSMAIGGCGKKETDKTDAADMTKTVPNYTLIYQSEQSSEAESANKNAEENTKENIGENTGEMQKKLRKKGIMNPSYRAKAASGTSRLHIQI